MRKLAVFVGSLLPLAYLLYGVQEANDPIKHIYTLTGLSAMGFLFLSLAITPLRRALNLLRYRRMLGLFALFYATLHFSNFFLLDAQLDVGFVLKETLDKPFIYLGMSAFVILIFMGITSTKRLFAKHHTKHKLVYIALILILIHETMAQKVLGDREMFFIFLTVVLLGWRGVVFWRQFWKKERA
ncbi:MAG: sulfoxide reductase heme-binding subunit YedZ [Campylobacterales bacterium]|nr:sulfoxide reductase heme-binding subunit YedZ [Campylobacterales bacterium]